MSARAILRHPLAWIAALALLLALLFPRYVDQPRAYFGALWQRAQVWLALERVDGVSADTMEIDPAAASGLWIVSKYALLRAHADGRREVVLTPRQVRDATGVDVGAFATAAIDEQDRIWVGGWHGTVLRADSDGIRLLSTRDEAPRGRIRGIAIVGDEIFVGGEGLWRVARPGDALQRLDDGALRVRALARSARGQLVAASDSSVFDWNGAALEPRWRKTAADGSIEALTAEADGALLVGTRSGVVVLEPDGSERTRLLADQQVRGFARDAQGRLWVATWTNGVMVPGIDGWTAFGFSHGLPDDSVSDLAIDRDGALWLTIYGDGAFRVPAERLQALASERVAPLIDDQARLYADACSAATAELADSTRDGGIARLDDGAQTRVFLAGRQVCPAAPGAINADGEWAAVSDGALQRGGAEGSRPLPLPAGLAAGMVTALHVDAAGRPWLGSRHLGVFVHDGSQWMAHGSGAGLAANPVQAIDSDAQGRIWVATYPGTGRAGDDDARAGLHVYDGATWHAVVPTTAGRELFRLPNRGQFRDLASRNSNDVRVLADGRIAVATNAGLTLLRSTEDMESFDRYNLGLPSNYVHSTSQDDEGRLWLAHAYWGAGVSWKAGPIFRNRNTRDGLFADRLVAVAHDARRRVWLLASDGRVAIYDRERLLR